MEWSTGLSNPWGKGLNIIVAMPYHWMDWDKNVAKKTSLLYTNNIDVGQMVKIKLIFNNIKIKLRKVFLILYYKDIGKIIQVT